MYVPESFRITDEGEIEAFMRAHAFVTLVSSTPEGLLSTHVPVTVKREAAGLVIRGHVARANSHWEAMNGLADSIVIFHGPHHYVSPAWYADSPAVPTWNYAVVHAHGRPQAKQDREFIHGVLADLVQRYESGRDIPWRLEDLPADYYDRLISVIVGFEMQVVKLEAKFKLGQNRAGEDRAGTMVGLENERSAEAATLAEFMRSHLKNG